MLQIAFQNADLFEKTGAKNSATSQLRGPIFLVEVDINPLYNFAFHQFALRVL